MIYIYYIIFSTIYIYITLYVSCCVDTFDLTGQAFDDALRKFLSVVHLPGARHILYNII